MYDELISYAEDKASECARQGEDVIAIRYWVGYADGLRAAKRHSDKVIGERIRAMNAKIAAEEDANNA